MTASLQHYLVITALGADRPGIVNTITRHVSSCGCNIEDSRLAMLGDEFTFIMLLSGSWNAINLIESTLPLKGAELELLIVMKRTTARPPQAMPNRPTPVSKGLSWSQRLPSTKQTNRLTSTMQMEMSTSGSA